MPFGSDVIKKIFTFTLLGRIVPVFGSLAFAVYIGFIAWQSVGPEKPEPDRARKTIATAAVNKAVEEIRASRGDIRSAVMVHFANDPSDFVSDAMRNKLNASGVLFLEDITFSERIDKLLNLRTEGVSSTRDALAAAKGKNTARLSLNAAGYRQTVGGAQAAESPASLKFLYSRFREKISGSVFQLIVTLFVDSRQVQCTQQPFASLRGR